jgi:XTP/dITP diphosphohydrolase
MRLVVATRNRGKLDELRALCAGLAVEVVSIEALCAGWEVEETGSTFAENAILKARAAAAACGEWALGDDSGLEVDALAGAPGVHSARYAGETQDDEANKAKLLAALAEVPDEARGARFRCVLALASPAGEVRTTEGSCEGRIVRRPRGQGGFGYDPLFEAAGTERTMAELPPNEKNRISHRGRALEALRPLLAEIAG